MSPSCEHRNAESTRRTYLLSGLMVVFAAVLLAGCSRSSFLGRQFDDLTARFNTYYNANRTFEEQERRLQKEDERIDMDRYLLVYRIPEVQGRSAEFEKVIDKCADLLRKHPQSKWVDDALMLIGKSYFYQSNYVGAEQKFNEVIRLGSSLHDEAVFWLARTLVASQSEQAAEDLIRTSLASENLEDEWRPRLHILLGDLRTDVEDWEGAIQALDTGLDQIDDGDVAARAQFLLGQLYETVGNYPAAIQAYRDVRKHNPLYELSFAAMYSEYRVQGLYGDSETALAGLEKMHRDNKHYQYVDRIESLRARVHASDGDPSAAISVLRDVLYPPPGRPATSIRGEIHYRLGEIYRDQIGDFYRSAAHFDTAASALRTTRLENEVYTPDAIVDARSTAEIFAKYRRVMDSVSELDSLLYLGTLDDEAFDQAVRQVREQLAREAARAAEELERRQARSSFRRNAISEANKQNRSTTTGSQQSGRFGFLNHKDIRLVQEGFLSFRQRWGERPLIPGWRREEVVLSTLTKQQENEETQAEPVEDPVASPSGFNFLPAVDVSRVPRDSASRDRMRSELASERYKLANVLFLSMGLPDSAARWYRLVIDQSVDESVALRAKYAMAEVHQALGDFDSANRLLMEIIEEHPESVFAERARTTLGFEIEAEESDTLAMAMKQYRRAYEAWNGGDLQAALDGMIRTAADYPRSEVAAKSMLAGAAVFTLMARRDSLDLFGIIPLSDSLFTAAELRRARAGIEADSVRADSLGIDSTGTLGPGIDLAMTDSSGVDSASVDRQQIDSTKASAHDLTSERVIDTALVDSGVESAEPSLPDSGAGRPVDGIAADTGAGAPSAGLEERDPAESPESKPLVDPELQPRSGRPLTVEDEELRIQTDRVTEGQSQAVDDEVLVVSRRRTRDQAPDSADTSIVAPSVRAAADKDYPRVGDSSPAMKAPSPDPKPQWVKAEYLVNDVIPQPLTLHTLFTSIEKVFADTEFGRRASSLKRGLIAYRVESAAPPDAALEVTAESDTTLEVATEPDTTLEVTAEPDALRRIATRADTTFDAATLTEGTMQTNASPEASAPGAAAPDGSGSTGDAGILGADGTEAAAGAAPDSAFVQLDD